MRIRSNKELFWLTLLLISGFLACNRNSSNDLSLISKIAAQPPRLVIQTGHSGEVYDVAFSPDGKLFASGSEDRNLKLWDVATSLELRSLEGHTGAIKSIAFSPDGKLIASGSDDKTIKLWDVTTGKQLHSLTGHTFGVTSVAFSPDGRLIASGSGYDDRSIRLWDVSTGQQVRAIDGYSLRVAYSPDGKTIMSGMRSWDAATGQELHSLEGSTFGANTFAISPDGKLIAIGTRNDLNSLDFNQTIKLWDVASGKRLRSLEGQVGEINSIAFSRDGKLIACGSRDHSVRLWDAVSGTQLPPLTGHADVVDSVAFSPDARFIVSGSRDKTVRLWDTATLREHDSPSRNANDIFSISVSPGGNIFALSTGHQIKLWEVTTGQPLRSLEGLANNSGTSDEEPSQEVSSTFSPDGRTIAAADNHSVKLLDTSTGKLLRTFAAEGRVVSLAFSGDGKVIASGWNDATVKFWNVATGEKLRSLSAGCRGGHDRIYVAPVFSVNYSPDGQMIASACGGDGAIKFWNPATGVQLRSPEGYYHGIYIAFSPNGKIVASCCSGDETTEESTISLWNSANGRPERTLEGVASQVRSLSFSPDGKLISGSLDKSIKLWDAFTGRQLRSFEAVNSPVEYVGFTPDGKLILSLGQDNLIRLWQLDGKLVATLASLDQKDWVVFTPDGLFDASPGAEESLHFVVNTDAVYKTYPLGQFKERYYRRGLLQEILRGEPVS